MITIVDYGMGNLRSVQKAFAAVGLETVVTGEPEGVEAASAVVLPGVGAYGEAMENLRQRGLDQAVISAIAAGKPFIGICLGYQLLFDEGEESFGGEPVAGLGIVPGRVRRFPKGLKVPQIGWNQITFPADREKSPLFAGIPEMEYMYFVHSYYAEPADRSWVAAETEYGVRFASAISKGNVHGIQFHPEKSSWAGLRILENFGAIAMACWS